GGSGADTTAAEPEATTTTAPDVRTLAPTDALDLALDRLRTAGTFTYQGTSLATDVSPIRPGVWLTVELTHTGEADLAAGELHDIGVADDGRATETVTDGTIVWGREADSVEALDDTGYLTIGAPSEVPEPSGALLLPTWLEAATTVEDLPDDGSGLRRLRVVVPADVFGVIVDGEPAVDAEVVLGLDTTGNPVRVEVGTIGGPPLRLTLDLVLGAPVVVDVPEPPATDDATTTDDSTGDADADDGIGTGTGDTSDTGD
ncbi:MAG TPA: hypothetical protein VIL36_23475, partial [Acidimicrobiales bacterium]